MAANHFRYAPHHQLLDSRDSETIRRHRRIEEDLRMNCYEQMKIANAIRVVVGPYRTVVICFDGVRGVMTIDMSMDKASAMVRRAMVVDMCMNERGGERSPLERY